ncbi:protein translocase subunit SecF [Bounagaea algeriensis]
MTTPGTETTGSEQGSEQASARRGSVFHQLHTGTGAFNIVGQRRRWFLALGLVVVICLAGIGLRGFNLGIDFVGGTQITVPATGDNGRITTQQVEDGYRDALGYVPENVQIVGAGGNQTIELQSRTLDTQETDEVKDSLFNQLRPHNTQGNADPQVISDSAVSGTWGGEITRQAVIALVVFLALVTAFLVFYFERWMAVSAVLALLYDLSVTAGVYSWTGFEVTPATVIGLLTILGYSLYDTVVVFDKVKENTRGLLGANRRTYGEAANLAINQTLMRSINTSVVGLLPVLGLLIIGAWLFGVGVLRDLGLVQGVGMFVGTFSSVLLAVPLLVTFKMRERRYREHAEKVVQRRAGSGGTERRAGSTGDEQPAGATGQREAGEEAPAQHEPETWSVPVNATGGGAGTSARSGTARKPRPGRKPAGGTGRSGQAAKPTGKAGRPSGKRRR